eukprot:262441-Lingulodinium_polyedra.AAC.1
MGIIDLITGGPAAANFCSKILEELPSAAKAVEPEQAVQALERVRASDLHRLAPASSQNLLKTTMAFVSA